MQTRNTTNLTGIDISNYDKGINYDAITAKVVYMRTSEGSFGDSCKDPVFTTHNAECRKRGHETGAYHFSHFYATSTIQAQVDNFLSMISGQTLSCRIVIDCENDSWHDNVDAAIITAQALEFADKVKVATGVEVICYANTDFIVEHFTADISRLRFWIADTRYGTAPGENGKVDSWVGFQYSDSGNIGGVAVDEDEFTPDIVISPYTYGAPAVTQTVQLAPQPTGDSAVLAYQQKLNRLHIASLSEDGLNGPCTKAAVISFEQIMGLDVDSGVWGGQCEGAYNSIAAKPTLSQGNTGEVVRYLQYRLNINYDGIFGGQTLAYVEQYQRNSGLYPDGIVGPDTWGKLIG
jgi:GH25 family lysozyme M1 (1,4-beta-N-acetylmuramidase)